MVVCQDAETRGFAECLSSSDGDRISMAGMLGDHWFVELLTQYLHLHGGSFRIGQSGTKIYIFKYIT